MAGNDNNRIGMIVGARIARPEWNESIWRVMITTE